MSLSDTIPLAFGLTKLCQNNQHLFRHSWSFLFIFSLNDLDHFDKTRLGTEHTASYAGTYKRITITDTKKSRNSSFSCWLVKFFFQCREGMTVNPHPSQTTAGTIHLLAAILLGRYSFCFKPINLSDSSKVTKVY